jgi:folate-binding protein YgfZ
MPHGAALSDLPRTQVVVTGKDRVRLLQGLTTNDVKRLQPGDGCESFLTNVQGKVVGYVYVFCSTDALVLDSVAGQGPDIIRSLDKYVIREDVKFADQSDAGPQLVVSGEGAAGLLAKIFVGDLPANAMQHVDRPFLSATISIRRTPFAGTNSFQLRVDSAWIDRLRQSLLDAGAEPCNAETLEVMRIEAGTPLFGRDITAENLPQEVDRNQQAISFTKGCYLGQETVARIDALGHVNRTLRGLRFESSNVPPPGAEVIQDGKTIAKVTSACFSRQLAAPLALAYVRRGQGEFGTRMSTEWGTAEVIRLPL